MESKELLIDDTEDSQESNEGLESNEEKTEAANTETVDQSSEFETNESPIESDSTTNLNDDEAELTALEKTKPEVSHLLLFIQCVYKCVFIYFNHDILF